MIVTWLLDAGVFIRAEHAGRLVDLLHAAETVPVAVVREVYDEVTAPQTRKAAILARAVATKRNLDTSKVVVREIPLVSKAANRFAAFRSGRATANDAGEAASVALAVSDDELVFVTVEKGAAWLGLREIHPRVTVLAWFLRSLVESGAMSMSVATDIASSDPTPLPFWWPEWISGYDSAT